MPFGEYELSPGLIGLSLLHSAHPEAFQRLLVRASITCYRDFTLAKCRSPGFASAPSDSTPCSGSLSLRMRGLAAYPRRRRQLVGSLCKRHAVTRTWRAPTACGRVVSGSISSSCAECFSPFPHGTGSLSVSREYLALPDGPGGFGRDYTCPDLLRNPHANGHARVRGSHPLRRRFPGGFPFLAVRARAGPTTPGPPRGRTRFGLFPFRSPLLGESSLFSLPAGTKMFQFPAFASRRPKRRDTGLAGGLSHSETRGSKATCAYPRIIAACHVLLRLREPRHPPRAQLCFLAPGQPAGRLAVSRSCLCIMSKIVHHLHVVRWRITDSNR